MIIGDYVTNQFDNNEIKHGSIGKIIDINNGMAEVEFDFLTYKEICEIELCDIRLIKKPVPPTHTFIGVQ